MCVCVCERDGKQSAACGSLVAGAALLFAFGLRRSLCVWEGGGRVACLPCFAILACNSEQHAKTD